MQMKKVTGLALATAAAAMFATTPVTVHAAKHMSDVKCNNVNKCKGSGMCKTKANACAGHNACKGQGFVKMSKAACDAIGGEVAPEDKA